MAEVAKGIIDIEINTGRAASQLQALQTQINAFNLALNKSNKAQGTFAAEYSRELQSAINKTGLFTAETIRLQTAAATLDKTLSKGKTSLGQFFSAKFNKDSAIAAETMALASERARRLQTQFIATSGAANGFQDALAVRPLAAFSSEAAVAAQKTQILSSMFKQGTTQLINFGKNVQWAGRQLMVGFTVPLTIFGSIAGKTFMDLEKQVVGFKKVYGDLFTTPAELNQNLEAVKGLAAEYTKYGIAVKDTIGLAAQAAAAGRQGAELTDSVTQSTRLATLGQMDQNSALETTISLQSAFKLSGQDLADTINFLNMVENQTVVSLQDIAAAIPRVAPVISGLGGDVKDLTVFLAAMQEGGVDAAEGANALKSGLASLINPTKQATAMLSGMGINLETIIQANKGDLMGTVQSFAQALGALDQFSRQQALEQVFGKFQYAKLGALFENITREGSQAQQVIATLGYTTEQLASTADKELKTIEESFGVQLTGAVERFKLAIAPIGELFVRLAIPLVNFATTIAESFNGLSDTQKRFAAIAAVIVGVVIPAVTMMTGLFLNLIGTLAKIGQGIALFGKGFITGGPVGAVKALTQSSKYLSLAEMDAAMAAQQLSGASQILNTTLMKQVGTANAAATAIANLTRAYSAMAATQAAASGLPSFGVAGAAGAAAKEGKASTVRVRGLRRNSGGGVPGSGNTDTVPAMLTPGEFVINKEATKQNLGLLKAINNGAIQKFSQGGNVLDEIAAVRALGFGGTGSATSIRRESPKQQTGMTFAHMQRNLIDAKTPQGRQYFDDLYRLLSENGMLKGNQVATYEHGSKNAWQGWRVTGNLGFDVSRNTTLPNGEILNINSRLNRGGIPANILLEDLNKNFSAGKNPYARMLRNVGIKDRSMIENISSLIHKRVTQDLASRGINPVLDSDLYKNMTKITVQSMRDGLADNPNKTSILKNLFSASEIRTGRVPRLSDPTKLSDTKYGISGTLSKLAGRGAALGRIGRLVLKRNSGGPVPGSGNKDTVPAMLTPGEFVVNKKATSQNQGILEMMNGGKVKGYAKGGMIGKIAGALPMVGGLAAFSAGDPIAKAAGLDSQMANLAAGFAASSLAEKVLRKSLSKFGLITEEAASKTGMVSRGLTKLVPSLGKTVTSLTKFAGPVGLIVTAGIALRALADSVEDSKKASIELTNAMYGSADKTKAMGDAFGRETNATTLRKASVEAAIKSQISPEAQQASSDFMKTDAAKQMLIDIEVVKKTGGDAALAIRNQLASSIMAGVITPEEASAIAVDLGTALNDKGLSVRIAGSLTTLIGKDGKDLLKNAASINAEITPQIDERLLASKTQQAYDNLNPFQKMQKGFFGGEEAYKQESMIGQISDINTQALQKEAEARSLLNLALQQGTIALKEYDAQILQINASNKTMQIDIEKAKASALGFGSIESLNNAAQAYQSRENALFTNTNQETGKPLTDVERRTLSDEGYFDNLGKKALESLSQNKNAFNQQLIDLGMDETLAIQITKGIEDSFTSAQAVESSRLFGKILSSEISLQGGQALSKMVSSGEVDLTDTTALDRVANKISFIENIPSITKVVQIESLGEAELSGLYSIAQQIENFPDPITKTVLFETLGFELTANEVNQFMALDPVTQKDLVYNFKVTMTQEVIKTAKQYTGGDFEVMNKAALAANKKNNEKSVADFKSAISDSFKGLEPSGPTDDSGKGKEEDLLKMLMERFRLQEMLIDKEAEGFNKRIKQISREIQLQQRQVALEEKQIEVRQKALEELSKKEDEVNTVYDNRISALDRVSASNSRLASQEQSRISLASALASGDIAAAASAMSDITQQSAESQIEDTKTALETQRETALKNLTVDVNGTLMTRKGIEEGIEAIQIRIDAIQTSIYDKNLAIQGLEDELLKTEDKRLKVAEAREKVETRLYLMEQKKAIEGLTAQSKKNKGKGLTTAEKQELAEYKLSYNNMAALYNEQNPYTPIQLLNRGGQVSGTGMTDTVPAMLTPGEFVIRKGAAKTFLPLLESINSGVFPSIGGMNLGSPRYDVPVSNVTNVPVSQSITNSSNASTMYNNSYSINVNVSGSNSSADEIANVVMGKIARSNSGSIRGSRY
jgi:hypothetical protein